MNYKLILIPFKTPKSARIVPLVYEKWWISVNISPDLRNMLKIGKMSPPLLDTPGAWQPDPGVTDTKDPHFKCQTQGPLFPAKWCLPPYTVTATTSAVANPTAAASNPMAAATNHTEMLHLTLWKFMLYVGLKEFPSPVWAGIIRRVYKRKAISESERIMWTERQIRFDCQASSECTCSTWCLHWFQIREDCITTMHRVKRSYSMCICCLHTRDCRSWNRICVGEIEIRA